MSFAKLIIPALLLCLGACQDVTDDLDPSGSDRRPEVVAGSTGHAVGQLAPDLAVADSLGNDVTLSTEWGADGGAVLYFAMWCPICDSHMSHMRSQIRADFPAVRFLIVDYVTGSVGAARSAQISNGYTDFTVLADSDQSILDRYHATMGTTVVIDGGGVVRMNEDYKDGTRLRQTLEVLP